MAGRSIPRRISETGHVIGDFRALCDYCGAAYMRSELVRDEAGLLVCPGEGEGLDSVALDREVASSLPIPLEYEGTDAALDPKSTDVAPVIPFFQGPPWR